MLIPILTFIVVASGIFGAYWMLIAAPEVREQGSLRKRLKGGEPTRVLRVAPLLKEQEKLSSIPLLNALLNGSGHLVEGLKVKLDSSGLPLTVGRFLLLSASAGVTAAFALNYYTHIWQISVWGLLAAFVPLLVVKVFVTKRLRKFEEQFPEAIDLIARSMRAGHAFATGLKMAADELPPPAGIEFKKLYERQNYGAQMTDSLRAFADRIPSLDARFFVTAVLTQRETGGNLAEVLDRLAAVMRERFKIRRDVRVRSAHGRLTAYILAAMPPTLAIALMLTNPTQFKVMFTDPLGIKMLEGALFLQVTGVLIVRKIVDIEY
jgi:tight adherence protein B